MIGIIDNRKLDINKLTKAKTGFLKNNGTTVKIIAKTVSKTATETLKK